MNYKFKLTVGDWSKDGHNQSEDFIYNCSHPLDVVKEAYIKGCEKLGFDLIDDYCEEYEDCSIPIEIAHRLEKETGFELFVPNEQCFDDDECGEKYSIEPEVWAGLVMVIANFGNPEISFSKEEIKYSSTWHIGGYGLYY